MNVQNLHVAVSDQSLLFLYNQVQANLEDKSISRNVGRIKQNVVVPLMNEKTQRDKHKRVPDPASAESGVALDIDGKMSNVEIELLVKQHRLHLKIQQSQFKLENNQFDGADLLLRLQRLQINYQDGENPAESIAVCEEMEVRYEEQSPSNSIAELDCGSVSCSAKSAQLQKISLTAQEIVKDIKEMQLVEKT